MRKLFLAMAAVAALLASCSKDDVAIDIPVEGDEMSVTFDVSSPELATRYGEGNNATTLEWYVYEGTSDQPILVSGLTGSKTFQQQTNVTIKFIMGRTYHVLFWAHAANAPYKVDDASATLTVDYDNLNANEEDYDAFYNYYNVGLVSSSSVGRTVELKRPFAQLNVATSDTKDAEDAGYKLANTGIVVKTYEKMNFMTGAVSNQKTTEFKLAPAADGTITANGQSYDHISMNYLLVNTKERVDVTLSLQEDNSQEVLKRVYTSIPVERNHRTNILGNVFTKPADFTVVIDQKFTNDYYEEWDGQTYDPLTPGDDGYYSVSHAAEFAWILQNVKEDVKIRLEADINFGGHQIPEWGGDDSGDGSTVIIEGNGNTIYNFVNTIPATRVSTNQVAGLFEVVYGAEVSNLTIDGAKVDAGGASDDAYAGVLFGSIHTGVKLTNVTVKNSTVAGVCKVGGLIGFSADSGYVTIDNCHVVDTDITTHDMPDESGQAGGLIGYITLGNNKISNSSVKGGNFNVINGKGNQEKANGKLIGVIQSGKIELTNCTAKDVSFNETGADNYTSPYGELVGGNRGTATVVIDGVAFIVSADGDITVEYEGETASVVATSDSLVEALENGENVYLIDDITIDPADMSNAYGSTGINVKNGQTINGNGNTLDIKGAGGTWDSGINTTGGLIKNITVTGSFRGIFVNHNSTHSETVVLQDVTIEGTTYTISCDQGMNQGLEAYNSTFKGWTSFAATLGNAKFDGCYFGEGNGYAYCRPYAPTEFVGCEFEAGFELDARAAVTFENCTLNGEPLTADNLATLVTSNIANATVK